MAYPWSTNQLKKLGRALRDDVPEPPNGPSYQEVLLWYSDLAVGVQSRLDAVDWSVVFNGEAPSITSRAKTIDTLKQKLQRDRGIQLPAVQDIAGVRVEADVTLREQEAIARRIAREFDHDPDSKAVWKDMRDEPHSGYRGLHVWLRLDDGRVEVQVRTKIQSAWANLYETAADVYGRNIRYGEKVDDPEVQKVIEDLQTMALEPGREIELLRQSMVDFYDRVPRVLWRIMFPLARKYREQTKELEEHKAKFVAILTEMRDMIREVRDRGDEA